MPRGARVLVDGGYYHIVTRGIDRRRLFRYSQDFRCFLDIVKRHLIKFQLRKKPKTKPKPKPTKTKNQTKQTKPTNQQTTNQKPKNQTKNKTKKTKPTKPRRFT